MDCHDMVASSLAGVIRQSLNPDFRKECYLLLGVTNNKDAQEVILSRLKLRGLNTKEKTGDLIEKRGTCDESHIEVPAQSTEKLDDDPPATGSESYSVTTPALNNPETLNDSDVIQKTEPADSDDETQLDWDTGMS